MKRKLTVTGIVIGAVLTLAPLWAFIGTICGMNCAFATLAGSGVEDPRALSSSIGTVLFFQSFSFIACPIGIALCIFSILKLRAMHRNPPPLPPPEPETPDFKA